MARRTTRRFKRKGAKRVPCIPETVVWHIGNALKREAKAKKGRITNAEYLRFAWMIKRRQCPIKGK